MTMLTVSLAWSEAPLELVGCTLSSCLLEKVWGGLTIKGAELGMLASVERHPLPKPKNQGFCLGHDKGCHDIE